MRDLVLGFPDQLRWQPDLAPGSLPAADHVVVLGMGGSGMAARCAALLAAGSSAVVHVHQDYGLPGWAIPAGATVVAVSYSGNTVETVSGVAEAIDAGLPVAAVSTGGEVGDLVAGTGAPIVTVPGGLQPRAALGYQVAATAALLAATGAISDPSPDLAEAAGIAERLLDDGRGPGWALGADLGEALVYRIPLVVGGGGVAGLAAARWATQMHENAKRVAFSAPIPEMNHNLLEALAAGDGGPGRFGVIGLLDPAGSAANVRRISLTLERLGAAADRTGEVIAQGDGALARAVSLIVVGDVASVILAEHLGVDPTPVDALEDFKRSL